MSTSVSEPPPLAKAQQAEKIMHDHLPWAMGAGLIPVPLVDLATITGIQLKMIAKISRVYGVPFAENRAKSIIAALLGSLGSSSIAVGTLGSMVKSIPGFGTWLGAATMPVASGAFTYAIGKVFIQHFESGGTFLSLDATGAKGYFQEMVKEGKAVATDLSKKVTMAVDL